MTENPSPKDIDRLLAEADELARQIQSDAQIEMEEEHRLQFELHAQKLEQIKSEVQNGGDKKKTGKAGADGGSIHVAILDIVNAMKGLTKYLS